MTLDEFIELLERTPRGWRIDNIGRLRNYWGECPISELTGNHTDYMDPVNAGVRMGLSVNTAKRILCCADYITQEPKLRARLLKATGLEDGANT